MELGDIRWNFKDLQMRFMVGNKECVLQGNKNTPGFFLTISSDKLDKVLKKKT